MNIGIVGVGVVGSAIRYGFEKLGHDVKVHDLLLNTSLSDVFDTEVCYICVPTPSKDDGACDTSIVEEVVSELSSKGYTGTVAVKSTVTPGTTQRLIEQFSDLSICFVPEFLRERCAETDFTENHDLCIVGTSSYEVFNLIKDSHGKYPKEVRMVTPTEAELCKYFNNTFNSTLITFANSFFEICESLNSSYTTVKDCMVTIDHIPDKYLDCNKSFRGFGGMCLPKDTKALNNLCESNDIPVQFFKMLLDENDKYETTVYKGMRK
jgi:UDPglucose 6-dehydrogenase